MVLPVPPQLGSQGPRSKGTSSVFYNPAMSGSRTRSVLLLKYAIESGMLGETRDIRFGQLTASGLRARRWINELPAEMAKRISATVVDLDEDALKWAMESHVRFGTSHGEGLLIPRNGDLRVEVLKSGRHWVDIDPYGSPAPFIDSAIQSMARSGVMEISATDQRRSLVRRGQALMRRYGAKVRTDGLAHDSGMRVMLASISRSAARHDRIISPLLSVWDSHHLRVSFRILKSVSGANDLEGNIGWRVYSPREDEVLSSIDEGPPPSKPTYPSSYALHATFELSR